MSEAMRKIEAAHAMVSALCKPRGTEGHRAWNMSIPARPDSDPDLVIGEALRAAEAEILSLSRERDDLLSHRLNNDPSKVGWHAPRTVGHLRMQLETLAPSLPIAAVYFIKIGEEVVARTTGIMLSWESINNETNRIESGNKSLPKGIAVWAHENDGFGPEVLAYLGRYEELKAAKEMVRAAEERPHS